MTASAVSGRKGTRLAVATAVTLLFALAVFALDASPAFAADPTLTVSRTGAGTVTSNPSGINCGTDCSEAYPITFERVCETIEGDFVCTNEPVYQDVTLTASTPSGWSFQGWGGECSGTGECTVTMDSDKSVSATWVDVQNPSVSLTSPSGTSVSGTISVQASASDNDRVSSVQFFVGTTSIGTDTTAPYAVSFNTVGYDGSRTFRAVATDPSGRTAEASRTVMVDNTPPTLTVNSGPNGETFEAGTTQKWTFTAGDAHSGLQSVQCKVEANGSSATYGSCSGGTSSHEVSIWPEGDYTFFVRATDNVGLTTTKTRTFSIDDTTAPTVIEESLWPRRGATGVLRATNVSATFSEEMKPDTLTSTTFKLQQQYKKKGKIKWKTIPTTLAPLSNNNQTATLDPFGATEGTAEQPLAANKTFRGMITTGAKDLAGNPLSSKFVWTFKTGG